MPRLCTVCSHLDCSTINAAIVGGASLRSISGQWGISSTTLQRHAQHLPSHLVKAHEAQVVAEAGTLLQQVTALSERATSILDQAEEAGDRRTALVAIREIRSILELIGKVTGAIQTQSQISINTSAEITNLSDEKLAEQLMKSARKTPN